MRYINAVISMVFVIFLIINCGAEDETPAKITGSVSGKVTFVGEPSEGRGEIQVSLFAKVDANGRPTGPPDHSSEPLITITGEATYQISGVSLGEYHLVAVGWESPDSTPGIPEIILGMYGLSPPDDIFPDSVTLSEEQPDVTGIDIIADYSQIIPPASKEASIMTVLGLISASELGKTLAHEHLMVDFIGADKTGPHRYDPDAVVERMRPFLQEVKERGFSGFVDCTPAYLARDPEVLRRLAELTGVHLLTNTGYYGAAGDKYVPAHAFEESADQLAARWVTEWKQGIDDTSIKPGFIKIAVDPGPMSEIDHKLVAAAARTHLQTGLTIACHTGEGQAALEVLRVVRQEGVDPSALIIVHADGIPNQEVHFQLAEAGAWVEYDSVSSSSIQKHLRLITVMLEKGFGNRLLLSHDAGWYQVGEQNGGNIRPYTAIWDQLIPALTAAGVDDAVINELFSDNPGRAFAVQVRQR